MSTVIIHDFVPYVPPAFIPTPTEEDNGKYVGVSEGVYDLSFVDALPTPVTPGNKYSFNRIVTDQNNKFVSKLSLFQIVLGLSTTHRVDASRSSKPADILAVFTESVTSIIPSCSNIIIRYSGKVDASEDTGTGTAYPSRIVRGTDSCDIFVSIPFINDTAISFYNAIIHVTSEGYTLTEY